MFGSRREKSNLSLNDTELLERARFLFAALDIANITNALFCKRPSNTSVPRGRFMLKFPEERRTEGFSTQTTYTRGSSEVGGGIHEQRYAAERVLSQSAVKLRHARSAP